MKKRITTVALLLIVVFAGAAFGSSALADHPGTHPANFLPEGPQSGNDLLDFLVAITDWLFALLLIAATIFIILAAFQFVTSGGDAAAVTQARQKLLYAVIAVVVASFAKGIPIVLMSILGVGGGGGAVGGGGAACGGSNCKVFVTSVANIPGNVTMAGADGLCGFLAGNAGLAGSWTAWLSGENAAGVDIDAADKVVDGIYENLNGETVVDNKTELTTGALQNAIGYDEFGDPENNAVVWTGTTEGGVADTATCKDTLLGGWNSVSGTNSGMAGNSGETDGRWTEKGNQGCDDVHRIYCFEVP